MNGDWIERAKKDLSEVSGGLAWRITLFVPTGAKDLEVRFREGDPSFDMNRHVAQWALRIHAPVVGDMPSMPKPAGGPSTTTSENPPPEGIRSILAVPVFDPEVFQPNQALRPVVAIVTFASSLPADRVVREEILRTTAEGYAEVAGTGIASPA